MASTILFSSLCENENMDDDDNSELILEAILSTHEQQLQTLRQRRLSLLKIASFNIILLSILVGLAGVTVQVQLPIGLLELSIPIGFVVIAILMSMVKYNNIDSFLGPTLDQELTTEMNAISRDSALEDIVRIYEEAGDKNKRSLNKIDTWVFIILFVMFSSLISLLGLIVHSA